MAATLWNAHPRVTWLMPQLELDESRHRAKGGEGIHPPENADFQEFTELAKLR